MSKFREFVLEALAKQQFLSEEKPEAFDDYNAFCNTIYDRLKSYLGADSHFCSDLIIKKWSDYLYTSPEDKVCIYFGFDLTGNHEYSRLLKSPGEKITFRNHNPDEVQILMNDKYLDCWRFFVYIGLGLNKMEQSRDYEDWKRSPAGKIETNENMPNIFDVPISEVANKMYDFIMNDGIKSLIYHELGHVYDKIKSNGQSKPNNKNYYVIDDIKKKPHASDEEYQKTHQLAQSAWYNTWNELEQIYRQVAREIDNNIGEIDIDNIRNYDDLVKAIIPYVTCPRTLSGVLSYTEPKLKNKLFGKILDYIKNKKELR